LSSRALSSDGVLAGTIFSVYGPAGGNILGERLSTATTRTASASLFTATAFSTAGAGQGNKNLPRVLPAYIHGGKISAFQRGSGQTNFF
jgi:hypothetical protein